MNSNISLVADWQLESSIENLTPTLKNLLILHSKLVEIRKTIDKWGIIDETLNLKETQNICLRFNEKYNIVHRFFSGEYKNDVSKIKGWCNADSPKTFTDFKIICQGLSDLLQQQTKISTLIKSFSDKYLVNGSLLAINAIPQLDEDVKKISTFFTKNNKKEVPAEYQAFILNDVNHEIKQSFCKILSEFEREYFKILQNLPEFNIKEDLSLIDFSSFISELHEKTNILCNLNNTLSTILTNSEDQPKTVNSLLSCLSEVNELTALRDEYNQLPINKFFVKPVSFYESLKEADEFDSLVKTVTDALTLLKKTNLNSSKPLTIDDVNSFIQEKSIIFDDLKSSVEAFNLNLTALDKLLITDTPLTTKWELLSLDELVFQLKEMSENDAGLATWMQFLKYQRQMNELGFGWYIRELLNDSSQKDLASLFSVTLWQSWLDLHYENDTALRNFTLQDHKTLIKEFKDIDNKSRKINAMRILQQMSKKINEARWKYGTLERELVHQSELKKRHKPVRKLVNEIGNQILGYKRCWMMSPLTLSSYIPFGTLEFDTVSSTRLFRQFFYDSRNVI